MAKTTNEIDALFKSIRRMLGGDVRAVELTDDELCDALKFSIDDYAERVQNEIIDNNWISFYGKKVGADASTLTQGFMFRTFDMMKDYSYWFSKQVGLQQEGPWELKKDFFTIEKGKQVYVVPSGRTINKVMYVNPPTSQAALFANYGGIDIGFGGGFGQLGGGAYGPVGGFYTAPAADVAYLATDLQYKNRLLRCDLTYKVTAGPQGTHLIHLMSTPGSPLSFGYVGGVGGGLGLVGCEVWYTYYDTTTSEEADECARFHADDVILRPDQVTIGSIDYAFLNSPTKTIVRQLLLAKAKQLLGLIRGKFSGKVSIPQAEMTMDYQMLIQQGEKEYDKAMETLNKRLERLRPSNVMKENAEMMQSLAEIQKHIPLQIYTI